MRPIERNQRFTNPLANSASLYLRQHAHNPVFWYPWSREPLERAKAENKPILLSIGYSSCYWCHVMEREVFENLSIASTMNQLLINIKIDREERPDLDEIYMVARQLMTHEGGWPNNVFLTPDLKPFYAGGTYGPDESQGRTPFPRVLEWINYAWTTQEADVRATSGQITEAMRPHLVFTPPEGAAQGAYDPLAQSKALLGLLEKYHDGRAGGFFQAPKFPHECLLSFLLGYYEHNPGEEHVPALDMTVHSLRRMAAGGLYDQVGCGFHRYAVDKDWLVPHFEKMLYNQAMLARVYTDAARLTGNAYFADIARGVLDMVSGPFTHADGAFYASLDAEVDEVEGAYYVWSPEALQQLLTAEEGGFLIHFFALADVPHFPGHKAPQGQVLVARKPLDIAARENNIPYEHISAMAGQVLNKLLASRNMRPSPARDEKIIVSWNGLMIDAFAHAGSVFHLPSYLLAARRAVDFLLEFAIDNEGALQRIHANGKLQSIPATLEDYAFLIKGILTLWRATPDDVLAEAARNLTHSAGELFSNPDKGGEAYFSSQPSDRLIIRSCNCDDMVLPNANAVMAHNLIDLYEVTGEVHYHEKADRLCRYFLGGNPQITTESATILHAAMRLDKLNKGETASTPQHFDLKTRVNVGESVSDEVVSVETTLVPAEPKPGDHCELLIRLSIKEGWHINADKVNHSFLIPLQVDVQGAGVASHHTHYPKPTLLGTGAGQEPMPVLTGDVTITSHLTLAAGEARAAIKLLLRFQPCSGDVCHRVRDMSITL